MVVEGISSERCVCVCINVMAVQRIWLYFYMVVIKVGQASGFTIKSDTVEEIPKVRASNMWTHRFNSHPLL